MNLIYYAHSYRKSDVPVVEFFSELMRSERLIASLDPPSDRLNSAKPERHLRATDGMVAVLTARDGGVSPYILYEIWLCLRANKPLLVFVEDTLPSGLVSPRVLQRRFSRRALLRQVRNHRHAVQALRSYIGDDPPPSYQPSTDMRKCLLSGLDDLPPVVAENLQFQLAARGYATHVLSGEVPASLYDAGLQESLSSADLALAFVESTAARAEFFLGAVQASFVPTILLTRDAHFRFDQRIPREYQARLVDVSETDQLRSTVELELSIAEEEYVDLEKQDQVQRYAELLIVENPRAGQYSPGVRNIFVQELNMGDKNINYGQTGSMGNESIGTINNYERTWEELKANADLVSLASELERLRATLRLKAQTTEDDRSVLAVGEAESEARKGNGPGVIQKLASAGKWVLEVAKEMGVELAAQVLVKSIGVGG